MRPLVLGTASGLVLALSLQRELDLAEALPVVPGILGASLGGALGAILQAILPKPKGPAAAHDAPLGAWGLALLLALAFGLAHALRAVRGDALELQAGLLQMGALAPALVRAGQAWRVAAAPLLHGTTLHFALNGAALLLVAPALERRVGPLRTVATFALPTLAASAAVGGLLGGGLWSMASAGVFALLGGLAAVSVLRRAREDAPRPGSWVLMSTLAVAGALTTSAHGGACVLAAGLGAAGVAGVERLPRARAVLAQRLLGGLGALGLVGAAAAVLHGVQAAPEAIHADQVTLIRALDDASYLNRVAWEIATASVADDRRLGLAQAMSERSLELAPATRQFMDTLATVHYRNDALDAAAQTELAALIQVPGDAFMSTQLLRFLRARGEGAALMQDSLPLEALGFDRTQSGLVQWWPRGHRVLVVYAAEDEDGLPVGAVLTAATSSTTGSQWFRLSGEVVEALEAGGRLTPLWLVRAPEALRPGAYFGPHDDEVDALP